MKSIKPGRGPSMIGGIVGIFMICFGIGWTLIAFSIFPLAGIFGIFWTAIATTITVFNFKNATKKNRHSSYDIVDSHEEPDPFNERYGNDCDREGFSEHYSESSDYGAGNSRGGNKYCPYCGMPVLADFEYCNSCGKRLP